MCDKPHAELDQERAASATQDIGDLSVNAETAKAVAGDEITANARSKEESASAISETERKNRIQVSNTKKPLFFYLNLAKRYIKQHNNVELSALGMAIPTVVTVAEILKANGVAVEKKVLTSTVDSKDENKGRLVQKAKIEIVLEKKPSSSGF